MLRPVLTIVLLLGLFGWSAPPAPAQQASGNPRIGPGLATLIYGVYCTGEPVREDPAPETASGIINIVPTIPEFRFRQKIVPAETGIGFGVLATAPDDVLHDPVTVTVTHPPYPANGIEVERWITSVGSDGPSLMGFSFDTEEELVLGEWTFSASTPDGEELFFIAFEVVRPEFMPQVVADCYGTYLS